MPKILIIDDDVDIVDAIKMVLEANDYQVAAYYDMENVVDRVKSEKPDLLILDVMFPENPSGGFEMARTIHEHEAFKNLPVMILSAINEKFKLGFSGADIDPEFMPVDQFLEKPVDTDDLVKKIKQILAKK